MVDRLGQAGVHALVAFGADPALEASIGFGLGLFFVIAERDLQKVAFPGLRIEAPDRRPLFVGLLAQIVGFDKVPLLLSALGQIQAVDEAVDAFGHLFAAGHGVDHRFGAVKGIAAGKDPVDGGLQGHRVGLQAAGPGNGDALLLDTVQVGALADGDNDGVAEIGLAFRLVVGGVEAPLFVENRRAGLEVDARYTLILVDKKGLGAEAVDDFDLTFQGFFNLVFPGRHLFSRFQTDQGDVLGPFALGGQGHIDGHVAAAHHEDVLAEVDILTHGGIPQKIDALQHAFGIFVFHAQTATAMQADGHEAGTVTVGLEAFQGDVCTERHPALDFGTHLPDHVDFVGQEISGKPVFGNAVAHHAAGFGQFFENGHRVALLEQVVGRCDTGGAGTDDGHLFVPFLCRDFRNVGLAALAFMIGQKAMQFTDGQRLIHIVAGACTFTGMVADPAADSRERMVLPEELQGLFIAAVVDQGDVPLDAHMGRTGGLAGGRSELVDGVCTGHTLGIEFKCRPALAKAFVEQVGCFNGAGLGTLAAGGALVHIYIPRILAQLDREISHLSRDLFDLRQGHQVDVQMPAALHQFGRDDAHGAVVGGKGFIQLSHDAADGRLGLGHVYVIARIRQIQRCLYTGNAATDHQNGTDDVLALGVFFFCHCAFLMKVLIKATTTFQKRPN